jgi:hypothetical protein
VNGGAVFLAGVALLVLLILLEGWRQRRRYGRGSGKGASLAQAGMLDLQRHLEPQRKVEIFRKESSKTDRSESADPPTSGSRK